MAKVTGLGGVFYVVKCPETTRRWYREMLGITGNYGPHLNWSEETGDRPFSLISHFADDRYIQPGQGQFMINLRVDHLHEFLMMLAAKGVEPLDKASEPYGHFAWILDPDGIKIELWEQINPPA
jgi:catechol 2,3-dioxygenase-like lactoylglutathione lyase family enzyme